jgi:Fe-S oxidoreductase
VKPTYHFADEFHNQLLSCSRCGFCQASCPVYKQTLRPALNARGKMLLLKEVMDGDLSLNGDIIETIFQCTTCAGCSISCPAGVNVPEIIKQARKDMVDFGACHPVFERMNEVLEKHSNIYADTNPVDFGKERNRKAEYVYFIGCVGSYREDEATIGTLHLLDRLGVDYTLIDESCCSGVLDDVGHRIIEKHADHNISKILATGAATVITGCPYCLRTFNNKPSYAKLQEAGLNIVHISQFLENIDFGITTNKVVTYHDPCDLGRHTGIYEEPRSIIRKIAPNFLELRHNRKDALCCGAGGGMRAAYPSESIAIARRRLQEVDDAGAQILLTECLSCVHNLSNARLRKHNLEIYTITQFINMLLEEESCDSPANNHEHSAG